MKSVLVVAAAFAAFVIGAPAAIGSAEAQTVVIKRGHGHAHVNHPRKKVVIVDRGRHRGWDRGRHLGWRNHPGREHGRMHHHGGTVGVGVR